MERVRLSVTKILIPHCTIWLKVLLCLFGFESLFTPTFMFRLKFDKNLVQKKTHSGWREVIHWILWNWKTVWNGLTVSMTQKMLELIWGVIAAYSLLPWFEKKIKTRKVKLQNHFVSKEKNRVKATEASFIFMSYSLREFTQKYLTWSLREIASLPLKSIWSMPPCLFSRVPQSWVRSRLQTRSLVLSYSFPYFLRHLTALPYHVQEAHRSNRRCGGTRNGLLSPELVTFGLHPALCSHLKGA